MTKPTNGSNGTINVNKGTTFLAATDNEMAGFDASFDASSVIQDLNREDNSNVHALIRSGKNHLTNKRINVGSAIPTTTGKLVQNTTGDLVHRYRAGPELRRSGSSGSFRSFNPDLKPIPSASLSVNPSAISSPPNSSPNSSPPNSSPKSSQNSFLSKFKTKFSNFTTTKRRNNNNNSCKGRVRVPKGLPILFRIGDDDTPIYTVQTKGYKGIEAFEGESIDDAITNATSCSTVLRDKYKTLSNSEIKKESELEAIKQLKDLKVTAISRITNNNAKNAYVQGILSSNLNEPEKQRLINEFDAIKTDISRTKTARQVAEEGYIPMSRTVNYMNPRKIAEKIKYNKIKTEEEARRKELTRSQMNKGRAMRQTAQQKANSRKKLQQNRSYKNSFHKFKGTVKNKCRKSFFGKLLNPTQEVSVKDRFGKSVTKQCADLVKIKENSYYNLN